MKVEARSSPNGWSLPSAPGPRYVSETAKIESVRVDDDARCRVGMTACARWFRRMPAEHVRSMLDEPELAEAGTRENDGNMIGPIKHFRSLIPLAQEARKPIFALTPADGALGAHSLAAKHAYSDSRSWQTNCCAESDQRLTDCRTFSIILVCVLKEVGHNGNVQN